MKRLQGKVALVTGGTSGIGRASALAFAREGARVVVSGRREKEGQEVVAAIQKAGGEASFVRADVSIERDVRALVDETVQRYGRLDVAFNNAGIEEAIGPLETKDVETFDQLMNINVKGVWLSMKYQIPAMKKSGGGSIVNTSSVAGMIGFGGAAAYTATKHAVVGLTRAAAMENAKENIRINAVAPGAIHTDMIQRFTGGEGTDFFKMIASLHPIGRLGRSEEIADAVVWLSCAESSFVTGQNIPVDGGFTAQ